MASGRDGQGDAVQLSGNISYDLERGELFSDSSSEAASEMCSHAAAAAWGPGIGS
jgi:hypothetical protein